MQLINGLRNLFARVAIGLVLIVLGVITFAAVSHAGTGLGVTPNFSTPVNVGDTAVPVSIVVTNNSTSDEGNVTISNFTLIPSCGDNNPGCTTPDPDVFAVSANGTGKIGSSCAGDNFTIAEIDAATGKVQFTRTGGPLVLGFGQACEVNFTVDVLKAPSVDVNPIMLGIQTSQLGAANGVSSIGNPASGTGADVTTVNKASPTIATLLSDLGPVSVGATVHDSSTLTGATATAGGTVTYTVYDDAACSTGAQNAGTKAVTNGIVPNSNGITFNTPGTYNWQAVYSGDAANNPATSTCQTETLVVNKLASSVTTDVHNAAHGIILSAPIGSTVHDKATVAGSGPVPTGLVSFSLYSNPSCTGATTSEAIALAGGIAETSGTVLGASGLSYKAFYNGDATYLPSVGACEPLNAIKFSPTISTVLSTMATTTGAWVNDTATLSGASATAGGSVTYSVFTNSSCTAGKIDAGTKAVANGIVPNSNSLQFNSAGTFYWQAVYSGDAANNAATSTCTEEILVVTQPAGQYCSPGYWKQPHHFDSYVTYSPNQTFLSVFGVNAFPGKTLVQVLSTGGGGLIAYGRATVGALLNASALSSGLTPAQVIAKFVATYNNAPGGNSNGYYGSANPEFTAPENCPLN